MFHAYNVISGNIKGNAIDLATQYSGLDVLESPITKATKYARKEGDRVPALGAMMGGIFDVGSYYSAPNAWIDAFMEEQTEKPTPSKGQYSDRDYPFMTGVLYGLMGYRLNQDLLHYGGFSNMATELNPFK